MRKNHAVYRMFDLYKVNENDVVEPVFVSSYFTMEALKADVKHFAEVILKSDLDYMMTTQETPSQYRIKFGSKIEFIVVEHTKEFFFDGRD